RGKAKILKDLQTAANKAGTVLLASDNDREGEAISYHIQNAFLKKNPELRIKRIVFNEITPNAIRQAVEKPSDISMPKVNAQKARRVLDRIVGYHLSPILWQKVKNGLSAGRVQSVALRLICEREQEVENFVPQEYWTLEVELSKGKTKFTAALVRFGEGKVELKSARDVEVLESKLKGQQFIVREIKETEKVQRPRPPFTTSQLQQTAANRLGFTSKKTMQIAQQLYEGINIGSNRIGLITYMRTDSTRVSDLALKEVRSFIQSNYPGKIPETPNYYSVSKEAQDAHEAIRPTIVEYTPAYVKPYLTKDQYRLYAIIWERFVASQMIPAVQKTLSVDIQAGEGWFRATYTRTVEKGFQNVLDLLASKETEKKLPSLTLGDTLELVQFLKEQHFTQGPARYTDATIVKALEEKGIGRPSTYAPIISVLLDRYYVVRKNRQLVPTVLGRVINDLLVKSFPDIVDVNFTAEMEEKLDRIEINGGEWVSMLRDFYQPFREKVNHVMETLQSVKGVLDEETDTICELCGKKMIKKLGRYGFFLACSGFPACTNTKSIPLADCPRPGCGGKIVARKKAKGRGREFYGCTNFPACDFITYYKPLEVKCPKCGWFLVEKSDKKYGTHKACINPACDYLHLGEGEEE
ncbi:MAG: type I DNA topoisomerase, partial [Spirochaetales bacterium]